MPVPSLSAGKSTSRAVGPGNRGRLSPRGARELSAWRRGRAERGSSAHGGDGVGRRAGGALGRGAGEAAAILSPTRPGGGTERLASRARHRPARGGWRRSSATLTGPPELRHGAVARRLRARRHSIPLPGRVPDRFCDTGWPGPGGPGPGGPGNRGRAAVGIAGAPYGGRNRRRPIRRSESRAPQTAIALAPDSRRGRLEAGRAARVSGLTASGVATGGCTWEFDVGGALARRGVGSACPDSAGSRRVSPLAPQRRLPGRARPRQ